MSGLFDEIANKGDNIASGLRKVAKEEKTKNRAEEDKVSVVGETKGVAATAVSGKKVKGTPKVELQSGMGEKWVVEFQENQENIEITDTKTKQGVYIYSCSNTLVTVKGKVNNVILDNCVKINVILDDAVASVEVVNSQRIAVQINGYVPTVNIDKTDGIQVYLSEQSNVNFVYSKSSEMNILVPGEEDTIELPVPEQFQTVFDPKSKKLVTSVLDLNL
ncbi:adenylyl cyclase-associated protein CAP2 [Acrasis kona]|uniref:Adenylyl cyclase-associated protein CAP2 n=1 Tax=Acrasis kona TaxID=1008807 RepID=A0AAW2ZQ12_9EUKA